LELIQQMHVNFQFLTHIHINSIKKQMTFD
jgi:hypothetical protein